MKTKSITDVTVTRTVVCNATGRKSVERKDLTIPKHLQRSPAEATNWAKQKAFNNVGLLIVSDLHPEAKAKKPERAPKKRAFRRDRIVASRGPNPVSPFAGLRGLV